MYLFPSHRGLRIGQVLGHDLAHLREVPAVPFVCLSLIGFMSCVFSALYVTYELQLFLFGGSANCT